MNKTTGRGVVRRDDSLPPKPPAPPTARGGRARPTGSAAAGAAPSGQPPADRQPTDGQPAQQPPTYAGPAKTDAAPALRRTRRAARVKPDAGRLVRPRTAKPPVEWDDQVPARAGGSARTPRRPVVSDAPGSSAGPEQYIRLRVRVRGERLLILDSHLVDGPLSQAQGFSAANVYDITLDDRLLHAGALPDLGVQRSFVNPDGPPEQQGHHFTERPIYEFTARLPARDVTAETISRIVLRVHRVKEEARTDRLGTAPLATQFAREVRPVAQLVGLPESVLPAAIEARGGRTPSV